MTLKYFVIITFMLTKCEKEKKIGIEIEIILGLKC